MNRNTPPMRRTLQNLNMPTARPSGARGAQFDRITADDLALIFAISERARDMARQWRAVSVQNEKDTTLEANPTILQIDLSVVHLIRGLRLKDFLNAPALDFISENATIQQHINRPLHYFPEDVPLRFAMIGATIKA